MTGDSQQRAHILLPTALDHGFDYAVPEGMHVARGDIVQVTLGSRAMTGVVWEAEVTSDKWQVAKNASSRHISPDTRHLPPATKLKPILAKIDSVPPFSPVFCDWLEWVARYTMAPLGAVLKLALSTGQSLEKPPRHFYQPPCVNSPNLTLSPVQNSVLDKIISLPDGQHKTMVLDGITGSGKTEVYYGAIAHHLLRGQNTQTLVLLPEIALTHQWLFRFRNVFGFDPIVWHSGITPAARKRAYIAVANGEARVVVGARSALFLPFKDLRLITIDEEHEPSYKQDDGVLYHARDMAVARGAAEKIPVLLVSATPSLETLANIESGKYTALHLPERHSGTALPEVSLIDMRAEKLDSGNFISPTLRQAMLGALERGKQTLLFLNRRGYAPLVLCRTCGHRFQCPNCSAWMVLHKGRSKKGQLHCHHCGYHEPEPGHCPACEAENALVPCGPGVERIAEEVRAMLPEARLSLLSSDAAITSDEIDAIIKGERNILIGTQMVAKGHHFPKLTTVGVIDADMGLAGGDLRASERSFQLLHQLSGRAGREATRGHVYLQTYQPEHPVMKALAAGDDKGFLRLEHEGRQHAGWPPYGQLASLLFDGANETEVRRVAEAVVRASPSDKRIRVLGPAPAALSRLKGQYRYRVLVKTTREVHLQKMLGEWLGTIKLPRSVRLKTDVNPYNFV